MIINFRITDDKQLKTYQSIKKNKKDKAIYEVYLITTRALRQH